MRRAYFWEFAHEVGAKEDGGEAGGGRLEADLGQFGGVMAAEELGEVILEGAEFEGAGGWDGGWRSFGRGAKAGIKPFSSAPGGEDTCSTTASGKGEPPNVNC